MSPPTRDFPVPIIGVQATLLLLPPSNRLDPGNGWCVVRQNPQGFLVLERKRKVAGSLAFGYEPKWWLFLSVVLERTDAHTVTGDQAAGRGPLGFM